MADKLTAKVDAKTKSLRQKAGGLLNRIGSLIEIDSSSARAFLKAAITLAAVASVLLMLIAGADIRPAAVLQGIKDKYAFSHASGRGFPVEIHGSRTIRSLRITRGTAVLTDASFTIYDGKGREVITENHNLASPAMECAGKFSLLFDRMGKEYILHGLSDTSCTGAMEDSIICADVSASGRFAFVTNSELTNAKVAVFSAKGESLHKWKSVDYKISDVAISPSGRHIALCGISSKKGVLTSTVIFQEVGAKKNLREYAFEDELVIDIRFIGNSRIAVIGDDFAAFLETDSDNVNLYSFNGRTLNCYDIGDDGSIALVFSGNSDGRNAAVTVINNKCQELANVDTAMTSPYVELENGCIHLLNNSEVVTYNFKGNCIKQAEVAADCQEIFTSQGRLLAEGVMYLAEVENH